MSRSPKSASQFADKTAMLSTNPVMRRLFHKRYKADNYRSTAPDAPYVFASGDGPHPFIAQSNEGV
jgi:hypothetical protein